MEAAVVASGLIEFGPSLLRFNIQCQIYLINLNLSIFNVKYRVFFFHWYPPKKLKYGKPRLGVSSLT